MRGFGVALIERALLDAVCRALGKNFELGRAVCLSTSQGPRLAICEMVLNNTSWRFLDVPCVAGTETERVSELIARPVAGHATLGR